MTTSQNQTFIAKMSISIGEDKSLMSMHSVSRTLLIAASSREAAYAALEEEASLYSNDEPTPGDGGYYSEDHDMHTAAISVEPISVESFVEISDFIPVISTSCVKFEDIRRNYEEYLTKKNSATQLLLSAAEQVVSIADNEGCGEDYTVTSAKGVADLSEALTALRRVK